ncbi:MAG: hypothetical protein NTV73_16095 [Hyphomicrobiales bacterium]|nr:hypothetical protein [Hyphomicrobiales bacterium]
MSRYSYVLPKISKELKRFAMRRLLPTKIRKRLELQDATPDFTLYPTPGASFQPDNYDLIIATDLRFIGGSGQSTLEEVLVAARQGWKVGLWHIASKLVEHRGTLNRGISDALKSGTATLVNNVTGPVKTKVLLFRHPSVLNYGGDPLPDIRADHVLLVVNHTPIKLGRIDYLLPYCVRQLRQAYNVEPKVFPIGPLIRNAVNELYDGTVRMEASDWTNVFDLDRFAVPREAIDRSVIRIGRHSRPGLEKWPTSAADIRAAYPMRRDIEVHILGGSAVPDQILRGRPGNWRVSAFGAMPPELFLSGIDVFVYYHHPDWIEAFGRVIVEAMAAGLPVILPPHFEPLFKDSVIFSAPEGVLGHIDRLKTAATYRAYSEKARRFAEQNFGHAALILRLERLGLAHVAGPDASRSVSDKHTDAMARNGGAS